MNRDRLIDDIMLRIRARVIEREANRVSPYNHDEQVMSSAAKEPRTAAGQGVLANLEIEANDLGSLRSEIAAALEGARLLGQVNPRNPGLHNAAVQFVKKVMRRSLTWYTRPLHHFQGGAIRALQHTERTLQSHEHSLRKILEEFGRQAGMLEQTEAEISRHRTDLDTDAAAQAESIRVLEQELVSLRLSILALTERAASLEQRLSQSDDLKANLAQHAQILKSHGEQIASVTADVANLRSVYDQVTESFRHFQLEGRKRDRDIRRFIHEVESGASALPEQIHPGRVPPMFPAGIKQESDFDYFAFEDLYRGDENLIRRRQKEYLEYFRGRDNVLDAGCGRGEFLELLRDHNINAKGVELGTDQYLLCREKGLQVVHQDLFSYLESLPDQSLGGLFTAQVIEHMTASDQLRYVALAHQKTSPGSPVIFETINTECVVAVMRNFFLDPTHVRPIHPETLKFAMESLNFKKVDLRFSSPLTERAIPPLEIEGIAGNLSEFNQRLQGLNDLLYGNQDYAAIGWR